MRPPYFLRVFYQPSRVLHEQRIEAQWVPALLNFALTGANLGVVGILFLALSLETLNTTPSFVDAAFRIIRHLFGEGLESLILFPILTAAITTLLAGVFFGFVWAVAHALGGNGTWEENMYLVSILFLPIAIGTFFLSFSAINPLAGALLSGGWGVYILYLIVRAIAIANNLSFFRAGMALLIPLILAFVAGIFSLQ